MKNLFYTLVTMMALGTLMAVHMGSVAPRAMAAEVAPETRSSVKGDLVLDFLGAQRGYVEPCG